MAERDKWARIPATLIEVDQDFCRLRWNEPPCFAGPGSNVHGQTRAYDDSDVWTLTGTALAVAGGARLTSPIYKISSFKFFSDNCKATVNPGYYSQLPIVEGDKDLVFSFEVLGIASADARVDACFLAADLSSTPEKFGFDFNEDARTTSNRSAEVSSVTFEDVSAGWVKISFTIASADVTSKAYSCFIEIAQTDRESGFPSFAQLAIDKTDVGTYKPTEASKFIGVDTPCFNTLSSCQFPDSYLIEDSRVGLELVSSTDARDATWSGPFIGKKNRGLYVEVYLKRPSFNNPTNSPSFIDFGGVLSLDLRVVGGFASKLVWKYGSAEIVLDVVSDLNENFFSVYKLAAYISPEGKLSARYSTTTAQGDALLSSTLDQVTIRRPDSSLLSTDICGLLVYDYEYVNLSLQTNLQDIAKKGDRAGDALFDLPLDNFSKLKTTSGIAPDAGATIVESEITDDALEDTNFKVNPFFDVKLKEPPLILRFTERNKTSRLPETLRAIPSLISASNKAAQLSVGGTNEDVSALGSRDELTAVFQDHPYSDLLVDPYLDQRPYNPEDQGTFWGKWEARNQYRQGFAVRKVSGYELENGGFERTNVYNYLLEKSEGPNGRGQFTQRSYDILQSLRADRAVYPAASNGRLSADMTDSATTFTLEPVDVGDEYPAGTFRVNIGGEGIDCTRSGDDFTVVTRGLYGGADSHSDEDTVQLVSRFESVQVHQIAYDIITTALPGIAGNIPKDTWDALAEDFLPRLYSADITEPTGVEDLLGELTRTAPIYFYADVRTNQIEMEVIRKPSQVAIELTEGSELIADSVDLKEYPKERIDEVWVYYRIRDAAEDPTDEENYSQRFILVNPEEQNRRGRRSIKRIYSRWIVAGARDTAEEIAQAYISRFQNPPIRVSFDLDARQGDIWLGNVAKLISSQKQDIFGADRSDLNYQVIQAQESNSGHQFSYIAQSFEFFSPVNIDSITITIQPEDTVLEGTETVDQINLRELYNLAVATEIDAITFVVAGGPLPAGGTAVGAATGQTWSMLNPDDWSWSPTIELRIEPGGVIAGRGGDGGNIINTTTPPTAGEDGHDGLKVLYALTVNNLGIIGGGGGGGGVGGTYSEGGSLLNGSNGGGGAGRVPGKGGTVTLGRDGEDGTTVAGGEGGERFFRRFEGVVDFSGKGGTGGGLGQAGQEGEDSSTGGSGSAGGAAGNAIDGRSFVTYTNDNPGNIRGNEV